MSIDTAGIKVYCIISTKERNRIECMIKKVRVCNFKCYGPKGADFDLSRINFIFGDNSAGKSSFLQFISKIDEVCSRDGRCNRSELDTFLFKQQTGEIAAKIRVINETEQTSSDEVWQFRASKDRNDEYELVDANGQMVDIEKLNRVLPVLKGPHVVHVEANRKTYAQVHNETLFLSTFLKQAAIETSDASRKYLNDILERLGVPYSCVVDMEAHEISASHIHDDIFDIDIPLKDVGTGIDGLFNLAMVLCEWRGGILAIEEPETNVNEEQMSALTTVLIEEALGKPNGQLIVECHSELMLLKVMQLIKTHALPSFSPNDVRILYATRKEAGTEIVPCSINENGRVDRWPNPNGFFSARDRILFGE